MTDFNSSPDYVTPLELEGPMIHDNLGPGNNMIYKTPYEYILCIIVYSFLGLMTPVQTIFIVDYIRKGGNDMGFWNFFPSIFIIAALIIGSLSTLYSNVEIDSNLGIVIVISRKIFCCCRKKRIIDIKDIQQAIVQTDPTKHFVVNRHEIGAYEVIFKLLNGTDFTCFKGVMDKNGEGKKFSKMLRGALPQNIPITGNLAD